ncbi:hypothetical protein EV426DRAFT_574608 [Tirmania nivea]|nr:hypothetical protein EV426DRAFT_574608 [Tirmania nivea]
MKSQQRAQFNYFQVPVLVIHMSRLIPPCAQNISVGNIFKPLSLIPLRQHKKNWRRDEEYGYKGGGNHNSPDQREWYAYEDLAKYGNEKEASVVAPSYYKTGCSTYPIGKKSQPAKATPKTPAKAIKTIVHEVPCQRRWQQSYRA